MYVVCAVCVGKTSVIIGHYGFVFQDKPLLAEWPSADELTISNILPLDFTEPDFTLEDEQSNGNAIWLRPDNLDSENNFNSTPKIPIISEADTTSSPDELVLEETSQISHLVTPSTLDGGFPVDYHEFLSIPASSDDGKFTLFGFDKPKLKSQRFPVLTAAGPLQNNSRNSYTLDINSVVTFSFNVFLLQSVRNTFLN